MNCIRHFICIFVALALHAAVFAQPAPDPDHDVPALRVTAPNGASSVIIGSMHVAADGLRQPAASALDGARRYVVEGIPDVNDPDPLQEVAPEVLHGQARRANWAKALTDAQIDELRQNLRCQLPDTNTNTNTNAAAYVEALLADTVRGALTYKSAGLASDIAMYHCATPGLRSRDKLLERAALKHGLKPFPLESQAQVNEQRIAVPERIYLHILFTAFTPASREGSRRAVVALNTGDYADILTALKDLAETPADAEIFYKLMVAERNRAWMPNLTRYLDEGHAVVNVGAGHLPGPQGLIALLRSRGYQVDPILLPAGDAH